MTHLKTPIGIITDLRIKKIFTDYVVDFHTLNEDESETSHCEEIKTFLDKTNLSMKDLRAILFQNLEEEFNEAFSKMEEAINSKESINS